MLREHDSEEYLINRWSRPYLLREFPIEESLLVRELIVEESFLFRKLTFEESFLAAEDQEAGEERLRRLLGPG